MNTERFETPFFVGLLIFVAGLVLFIFLPELNAVVLAITFAVQFHPLYASLKKLTPKEGWVGALLTLFLAIVIILGPLTFFGFRIFEEAQGLYFHLISGGPPPILQFANAKLQEFAGPFGVNLSQYFTQVLGTLVGNLGAILSQLANVVWVFFLALFGFYYLLRDGDELQAAIVRVVPLPEAHTKEILEKLNGMASSVIRGSLVAAVGYGILTGLGFALFGLPSPVLWGAVSLIASLIPIFGMLLVAIPAIAWLVFSGNIAAAVGFAIWMFLLGIFMENFLRPRLIGRSRKVHPLLLLFSILGGLQIFGATGILLGPLALSLLLALVEIYPKLALERGTRKLKKE